MPKNKQVIVLKSTDSSASADQSVQVFIKPRKSLSISRLSSATPCMLAVQDPINPQNWQVVMFADKEAVHKATGIPDHLSRRYAKNEYKYKMEEKSKLIQRILPAVGQMFRTIFKGEGS